MCVLGCSVVSDSVTPWTVAHQTSLSMGFSRQEYWSELPFPTPGDLPNPEMEPVSLVSPALADGYFATGTTWEAKSRDTTVSQSINSRVEGVSISTKFNIIIASMSQKKANDGKICKVLFFRYILKSPDAR